jgi:hypothetical protein
MVKYCRIGEDAKQDVRAGERLKNAASFKSVCDLISFKLIESFRHDV